MLDRYEREKPHWADSEYIVGIIDLGDNLPWIAMEYMDGGSLQDRLNNSPGGLPLNEALWIGECICRGIEIAHNYGVAHLDIKPANVLFRETEDGTWDVPKIADWGLARILANDTDTPVGLSVEYAAPEQFKSDEFGDSDTLTDIYQAGAVVYTLLTGEPPYTGSQTSVMYDVVHGDDPRPPSSVREECPPELDSAVETALASKKSDRYRNISEFEQALNAIRENQRLPSTASQRTGPTENIIRDTSKNGGGTSLDTDHSRPDTTSWASVVDIDLRSSSEISSIQNALREGGIIFAKIQGRDLSDEISKELSKFISKINGDLLQVGDELLILTPSGVQISRDRLKNTVVEDHNSKITVWITSSTCPDQKIVNRIQYGDIVVMFEKESKIDGGISEPNGHIIQANDRSIIFPECVEAREKLTIPVSSRESQSIQTDPDLIKDWPMFGGNPAHSGYHSPTTGPQRGVTEQWKSQLGGEIRSSPAVVDGTAYIGSDSGIIYALNASNGAIQWRFSTSGEVNSSPAVADGTVYVGSKSNYVYALDASNGTVQWTFNTESSVHSSPAVVGDTVYITSFDGNLYALDAVDGSERWQFETDRRTSRLTSSPAVINGTVYFASSSRTVYALDSSTGIIQWDFETEGMMDNMSPTVFNSAVYVGDNDGNVYALDANDGTTRWMFETGGNVYASPAILNSTVYIAESFGDNSVYALDSDQGTMRGSIELDSTVGGSAPAVVNDIVYLGIDNHLYALNVQSRTQLWTFETRGTIYSSPAVGEDTVYIGSDDGNLYALQ